MNLRTLFLSLLFATAANAQNNLTQYVNPFVGTDGHGHTFPGATTPFAMVQLSPDTRIDGSWDGCSGYHYSDSFIYGFSHTHLSGTGCSDYGDIAFMPSLVSKAIIQIQRLDKIYYTFSKKSEKATPGYYSVQLNNGIKVELSATTRVGIQKYSYNRSGYAWITLNLKHRDELLEGKVNQISKRTFSGFRRSKAWAEDQLVYYYFTLNRDADQVIISKDSKGSYKVNLGFKVTKGQTILIKTALSTVDEEGAKNNLEKEMPHWDFQRVKNEATKAWESELQRIKVYGGSLREKQNFYTALYHCMIHPNILNDVDGRYRGRDKEVHKAEGFNYYTVFSLWDTYRAQHPLLNIIDKKRSRDFIMTFKAQYDQSGRLPMWELWGNETNCMIGFHSVSVIWNSYLYGVINLDELKSMYPAVYSEAMSNRFGLDKFRKRGYLTIEDEHESVSKTLEYAYNMYCVGMIAQTVGRADDSKYFKELSQGWRHLYNCNTGFMTPRSNGAWIKDFDPSQVNNHFTEANSWQYSFAVQHNAFELKKKVNIDRVTYSDQLLSTMFNTNSKTSGREQADITGLIGQYAHGNEPSHHVAYLFQSRDSVRKYVSRVCKDMYQPTPDGLIGNEDCGQMSAWYVFSAMGIYPANPSTNRMVLGQMIFDSVRFIQGDGEAVIYNSICPEIVMSDIYNYTGLKFGLSKKYYTDYKVQNAIEEGTSSGFNPQSEIRYLSAPVLLFNSNVFEDSLEVKIIANNDALLLPLRTTNYKIVYTLDGSEPSIKSAQYKTGSSVWLKQTSFLKAKILLFGIGNIQESNLAEGFFYKFSNHYDVKIKSVYNKQYTAGGDKGIFDGLKGDDDWRKGRWQGYQGQNFEVIVDTKLNTQLDSLRFGTLQDTRSWILYPRSISVYASNDSSNFELIGTYENAIPDSMMNSKRTDFIVPCNGKSYRYFKIVATNYGKLPHWHPGAGGEAFIFVDELEFVSR